MVGIVTQRGVYRAVCRMSAPPPPQLALCACQEGWDTRSVLPSGSPEQMEEDRGPVVPHGAVLVAGTQLPPPPPPHRSTTDPHPDPKPRPPGCCQLEGVAWLLLVVVVAFACAGAGCLGNRTLWSTWPKFKRAGWSVMGASYLAIAALMATRVVVRQWRRVHSGGRVVSGGAPGHVGAGEVPDALCVWCVMCWCCCLHVALAPLANAVMPLARSNLRPSLS
jgi:hypothetical protein